jgi:hypothetical protein
LTTAERKHILKQLVAASRQALDATLVVSWLPRTEYPGRYRVKPQAVIEKTDD